MQKETLSDEELMVFYQNGDFVAFEILYNRHSGRIYQYLKKKVSTNEIAQDLLQEVFSKIHKSRNSYNKQFPFLPWVFTVARNTAFDFFKLQETKITTKSDTSPELLNSLVGDNCQYESDPVLGRMLEKLPQVQKHVIERRYLDEWSFERIASDVGTSEENVRQLISRGIKKLRLYWQQGGGK
jgi:RNA polymerase sigma-70 factor (ECF subfamily)